MWLTRYDPVGRKAILRRVGLRGLDHEAPARRAANSDAGLRPLLGGMATIARTPFVRRLSLYWALEMATVAMCLAAAVPWFKDTLHADDYWYGISVSAYGIGAAFGIGFIARPLGGVVMGHFGDRMGRKFMLVWSLLLMGSATLAIGLLPTYAQIGLAAAILLFLLRLIQGLCLGGEYGGAITYVAEHIDDAHRGYYTGWLQTSPTLGIVVSLAVIIGTRTYLGVDAFNDWGWRIPFIISLLLVAIAIYIRLSLQETPVFQDIKKKRQTATNPWREAFMSRNIRYVIIASIV